MMTTPGAGDKFGPVGEQGHTSMEQDLVHIKASTRMKFEKRFEKLIFF